MKLGKGRREGGQSPRLPGLTGTAFHALVVSLSLVVTSSRVHEGALGSRALLPLCPRAALQQEGLGGTGGFLPCGDSASWETWVDPEPLPLVGRPWLCHLPPEAREPG